VFELKVIHRWGQEGWNAPCLLPSTSDTLSRQSRLPLSMHVEGEEQEETRKSRRRFLSFLFVPLLAIYTTLDDSNDT